MAYPRNTVLIINCGSSSLKFAALNPENGEVFLKGIAEALNLPEAKIVWSSDGPKHKAEIPNEGHDAALKYLVDNILKKYTPDLLDSIAACGHRIVHGGEFYSKPTLVTDEVVENIRKVIPFAPLHNPAHILGIEAARKAFPNIPHVAVFDTAFHQTMPEYAYRFAIPEEYYHDLGIRRYGAHGTSHMYLTQEAARLLNKPVDEVNLITCHLGNGASVTAVKNGKCVDTSMGLTPLDGLIMGTRCGEIDPSVVFFLCNRAGLSASEVEEIFNKKSGLMAITGKTSDMRFIEEGLEQGDARCKLAIEMFCYRLCKFIASYYAPLGHVDAIVFSGGIGENDSLVRSKVCHQLEESLGTVIDDAVNDKALGRKGYTAGFINKPEAKVKLMVIATNEELMIAKSAAEYIKA